MKKQLFLMMMLIFTVVLGLTACNMPEKEGEVSDMDLMQTAAQETVSARLTEAVGDAVLTPSLTPEADSTLTETTVPPTSTTAPVFAATQTPLPCNWVAFVDDVTYADNTQVMTGTSFVKTWRLKNIGTCAWTSGYRLIFSHGDRMNAPNEVSITGGTISPGETVDISASLVAPASPGTYQGDFLLRSSDNVVFGLGGNADKSFWVKVVAVAPNTATSTSTATATSTPTTGPKADLQINLLELNPVTPTKGNPVDVKVQVYNFGTALAVGPFTVAWYPGENYATPGCTWNVDNVNPNGGRVLTCTYAGYPSPYASINTKAIADTTNTVPESDEGNNTMLVSISVNP